MKFRGGIGNACFGVFGGFEYSLFSICNFNEFLYVLNLLISKNSKSSTVSLWLSSGYYGKIYRNFGGCKLIPANPIISGIADLSLSVS